MTNLVLDLPFVEFCVSATIWQWQSILSIHSFILQQVFSPKCVLETVIDAREMIKNMSCVVLTYRTYKLDIDLGPNKANKTRVYSYSTHIPLSWSLSDKQLSMNLSLISYKSFFSTTQLYVYSLCQREDRKNHINQFSNFTTWESCRRLIKTRIARPYPTVCDTLGQGRCPRTCSSYKFLLIMVLLAVG
jgi:hypothetical protein